MNGLGMSEHGYSKAASKIGEKLVEILDVFDLSFFMSGVVGISAIVVYLEPPTEIVFGHTALFIFGLVLGSYVLGLVCFAVGRWIRDQPIMARLLMAEPAHVLFHSTLAQQGLTGEAGQLLRRYFGHGPDERDRAIRLALYTRMWVHIRSFPELSESFALLKRYWILAASYDGVAVAILLWMVPLWNGLAGDSSQTYWPWIWTVVLPVASVSCWHRATQYKRYQIEEVVATTAHWLSLVGKPVLDAMSGGQGSTGEVSSKDAGEGAGAGH